VESGPLHSAQPATYQTGSNISAGPEVTGSIPRSDQRPKSAPAMSQAASAGVHVVTPGETLGRIARRYGKSTGQIAKANNIQASANLRAGDRLVIPGVRSSAANATGLPAGTTPAAAQAKPAAAHTKVASAAVETGAGPTAKLFAPATDSAGNNDGGKSGEASGTLPKFRWPANGRVIAGYGPSSTGQQNDGINIAVPENTPIKAAEDGVVAYAGNELKGYGNLVLVRHPNGYVTAYAHAKELLVKRGDQIKRGQVIARSGQTGSVNAPQLHFEVRKGASPLDPIKFLNGA
jgi:murein DD-endopeptidase MepM/ murein hydrolase activator NlpD